MKKGTIKIVLFLFTAVLLFSANDTYAQVKVGFVDSKVIIAQLPEAQNVQKQLEDLQKLYLDTVKVKETELKEKAEVFRTRYQQAQADIEGGVVTSEEEIQTLNEELSNMQKEIQTLDEGLNIYRQKIQNDLLEKQADLFKPVKEKITKAIEDVAKSMKLSFVFDKADGTLIYGDKKFDVTFKVMDKLK